MVKRHQWVRPLRRGGHMLFRQGIRANGPAGPLALPSSSSAGFKKVKYSKSKKMIIYRNLKSQLPLPERYRCRMFTYITSVQTSAVATNFYYITWNSYLPFAGSGLISAVPAIATTKPAGFSLLCINTCYQRYRVHGAKLSVTCTPGSVGDSVVGTIIPVAVLDATDENPTTSTPQPFAKEKNFVCNSNVNKPLVNSTTVSKITGYPASALANDMSGTYEALYNAAPATPLYMVFSWKTLDQANLGLGLPITMLLEQDIEFFGLNAGALPNT